MLILGKQPVHLEAVQAWVGLKWRVNVRVSNRILRVREVSFLVP